MPPAFPPSARLVLSPFTAAFDEVAIRPDAYLVIVTGATVTTARSSPGPSEHQPPTSE